MFFIGLGRKKKRKNLKSNINKKEIYKTPIQTPIEKSNVNKQEIYKTPIQTPIEKPKVVKKVSTNEISVKDLFMARSKALYDKEQEEKRKERERIDELSRPFREWLLKYNLRTIKQELYIQAKKGNESFTISKKIGNTGDKVISEIEKNIVDYITKFNKQDKNIQISYKKEAIIDFDQFSSYTTGYNFNLTAKFTYPIEDFLKDCLDYKLHPIIPIIKNYL